MDHNTRLVSVIMPCYNSQKTIVEAIESVIAQTYTLWELLVIDDASSDKSLEIVEGYCKRDKRIRLLAQSTNQGVAVARNLGVSHAMGKWIAYLDSDDLWAPQKLEKQIGVCEKHGAGFVFTGASYINEEGVSYPGIFEVPLVVNYNQLKYHNVISCSSVLLDKVLLSDIKMTNDQIHEDFALWLKVLKRDVLAYGINEPLLIYRISKHSKSGNKLKSFKMAYGVFREINLNPISAVFYTLSHLSKSVFKYKRIFSKAKSL